MYVILRRSGKQTERSYIVVLKFSDDMQKLQDKNTNNAAAQNVKH